ncbi:tRNA-2-methylthio-N(6)-dimethylallyladenosine synthase [Bienertia sinuspersici]
MYSEEDFSKITIKPWQLFTDKQHLRDVVRDYCIQTGFSIIVQKANNKKWTVLCSDERCGWRLHACRLSDGLTWVIKSIQNPKHNCLGMQIKNPMVTSKWVARVLLEDIRANNDIPAKSNNNFL